MSPRCMLPVERQDLPGPSDQILYSFPRWLSLRPKLQILKPVICANTVAVMDSFLGEEVSPKVFFHNERVFSDKSALSPSSWMAVRGSHRHIPVAVFSSPRAVGEPSSSLLGVYKPFCMPTFRAARSALRRSLIYSATAIWATFVAVALSRARVTACRIIRCREWLVTFLAFTNAPSFHKMTSITHRNTHFTAGRSYATFTAHSVSHVATIQAQEA